MENTSHYSLLHGIRLGSAPSFPPERHHFRCRRAAPGEIDLRRGQRPLIRALSLQQHPPLGLVADRVDPPPSESSSRISVAPPPSGPRRGALLHLPPPLASPRIPPPSPLLARGGSERGSGGPRIPPPPFARACWARARGIPQPPHPPRLRRCVVPSHLDGGSSAPPVSPPGGFASAPPRRSSPVRRAPFLPPSPPRPPLRLGARRPPLRPHFPLSSSVSLSVLTVPLTVGEERRR